MYSCLFEGRAGKLFPWSSAAVAFTGSYIRIPESHPRGLLILLHTSPLSNVRVTDRLVYRRVGANFVSY